MKILETVCLYLLFNGFFCEQEKVRLNSWADNLIEDVVKTLKSTDQEFVTVPDFREEIVEHLGKTPVKHGILAVEGVLGEITSLKRNSDVKTLHLDTFLLIKLPITFDNLGIHFDNCIFWCGSKKSLDELEIKVPMYDKTTNVNVQLELKLENKHCFANVSSVQISKFNNLDIIFYDVCISKFNKISGWATNYFNSQISHLIESELLKVFNENLKKHTIC